jgi:hypothetical protein
MFYNVLDRYNPNFKPFSPQKPGGFASSQGSDRR